MHVIRKENNYPLFSGLVQLKEIKKKGDTRYYLFRCFACGYIFVFLYKEYQYGLKYSVNVLYNMHLAATKNHQMKLN